MIDMNDSAQFIEKKVRKQKKKKKQTDCIQ